MRGEEKRSFVRLVHLKRYKACGPLTLFKYTDINHIYTHLCLAHPLDSWHRSKLGSHLVNNACNITPNIAHPTSIPVCKAPAPITSRKSEKDFHERAWSSEPPKFQKNNLGNKNKWGLCFYHCSNSIQKESDSMRSGTQDLLYGTVLAQQQWSKIFRVFVYCWPKYGIWHDNSQHESCQVEVKFIVCIKSMLKDFYLSREWLRFSNVTVISVFADYLVHRTRALCHGKRYPK